MDHFDQALQLLASGQIDEARIYRKKLLRQDPENADLLYNLGICYVWTSASSIIGESCCTAASCSRRRTRTPAWLWGSPT